MLLHPLEGSITFIGQDPCRAPPRLKAEGVRQGLRAINVILPSKGCCDDFNCRQYGMAIPATGGRYHLYATRRTIEKWDKHHYHVLAPLYGAKSVIHALAWQTFSRDHGALARDKHIQYIFFIYRMTDSTKMASHKSTKHAKHCSTTQFDVVDDIVNPG